MAMRVEYLDAVECRIPVSAEQLPLLAAVMERYRCETVGGLAELLVLAAINVERRRVLNAQGRALG